MPRPTTDEIRLYALAIVCGLVAEGGLIVAIYGGAPSQLAILLFAEAIALGIVFGARPGMVSAIVPLVVAFVVDLAIGAPDDVSGGPTAVLAALVFVAILQAFFAGMAGAMRSRYGRRARS